MAEPSRLEERIVGRQRKQNHSRRGIQIRQRLDLSPPRAQHAFRDERRDDALAADMAAFGPAEHFCFSGSGWHAKTDGGNRIGNVAQRLVKVCLQHRIQLNLEPAFPFRHRDRAPGLRHSLRQRFVQKRDDRLKRSAKVIVVVAAEERRHHCRTQYGERSGDRAQRQVQVIRMRTSRVERRFEQRQPVDEPFELVHHLQRRNVGDSERAALHLLGQKDGAFTDAAHRARAELSQL